MREFDVLGNPLTVIEFDAKGVRAIAQCIKTIITTWKRSLFLDRNFGIDPRIIDSPINVLYAKLSIEIIEQLRRYEPRVEVVKIDFVEDVNSMYGTFSPLVRIRIKDGTLI